jgi:hypothetical protein
LIAVGVVAMAALLAWPMVRVMTRGARTPAPLDGPRATESVAEPASPRTAEAIHAAVPAAEAMPAAQGHDDPSSLAESAAQKRGVALAQGYRDDVCRCSTTSCWSEVSRAYAPTVGLARGRSREEDRTIDAALRETSACIRRIDAAEAALSAVPD